MSTSIHTYIQDIDTSTGLLYHHPKCNWLQETDVILSFASFLPTPFGTFDPFPPQRTETRSINNTTVHPHLYRLFPDRKTKSIWVSSS